MGESSRPMIEVSSQVQLVPAVTDAGLGGGGGWGGMRFIAFLPKQPWKLLQPVFDFQRPKGSLT